MLGRVGPYVVIAMQNPPVVPPKTIHTPVAPDQTVRADKNIVIKSKPVTRTLFRIIQCRLAAIVHLIVVHLAIIELRRISAAVPYIDAAARIRYASIVFAYIIPYDIVVPGAGSP